MRYSAKADNFYSESSWFITGDAYYTEAQFISDWVMLAKRFAGTAVVGADLWEQPRGSATWGSGASTDWDLAATRAGRKEAAAMKRVRVKNITVPPLLCLFQAMPFSQ